MAASPPAVSPLATAWATAPTPVPERTPRPMRNSVPQLGKATNQGSSEGETCGVSDKLCRTGATAFSKTRCEAAKLKVQSSKLKGRTKDQEPSVVRRSRSPRSAAVSAEDQPQRPQNLGSTRWNRRRPLRPTRCGWCAAHPVALREKSSRAASILPLHAWPARPATNSSPPIPLPQIPLPIAALLPSNSLPRRQPLAPCPLSLPLSFEL